MFWITLSCNVGEQRAIGLIVNFSAALIICEIDDLIMSTARMQKFRDYFDELVNQSTPEEEEEEAKILGTYLYKN